MTFGLEDFKRTTLGRRVAQVVENPQFIRDMVAFCRNEMPALQAIGRALIPLGPQVADNQAKKTIGRWVREVLDHEGWVPWKTGRVSPGNLFSKGMIYRRRAT